MEIIENEDYPINIEEQKQECTINNCIYKGKCDILQMLSVPTLGIYSEYYSFMNTILALHQKSIPTNFPSQLQNSLKNLIDEHKDITLDFFHITLDGSIIYSENNERIKNNKYVRVNIIPHPYVFYNVNLSKEHRTRVYLSVFCDSRSFDSVKDSNENDGVKINPQCRLDDNMLNREILLHSSQYEIPAISPNNCSILLNLNNQMINFFLVTLVTYKNEIVKCSVTEFVIFPTIYRSKLFMELSTIISSMENEEILKKIYYTYFSFIDLFIYFSSDIFIKAIGSEKKELFENLIKKMFKLVFDFSKIVIQDNELNDYIKDSQNMGNFYYSIFLYFLNILYEDTECKIKNFGQDLLSYLLAKSPLYVLEILEKFKNFFLENMQLIFKSYFSFFGFDKISSLRTKYNDNYNNDYWPKMKNLFCAIDKVESKNLDCSLELVMNRKKERVSTPSKEIFQKISEAIVNKNKEQFINLVNNFESPIKNLLFYRVWVNKGKKCGIHNEFGKMSFLQSNEIPSMYHCTDEEIIDMCVEMISFLEKIDREYNEFIQYK